MFAFTLFSCIFPAGGTASGKTTVCARVHERFPASKLALISMDSFYRPLTAAERAQADAGIYNFDGPAAVDWPLFLQTLGALNRAESVDIPNYCFKTHSRYVLVLVCARLESCTSFVAL